MDDGDTKSKIVQLIRDSATPAKSTRRQAASKTASASIVVKGDGNTVAGRDIITTQRVVHVANFTPGPEHISEAQAYELKRLMDETVEVEQAVKKNPRDYEAVFGAFKARFKLASYRALEADRFDEALTYLRTGLGRLRSAKSAPTKLGDSWRKQRYAAIKARSRQIGAEAWLKQYLADKFLATSLTELSDKDLDTCYRTTMAKKS